MPALRRQAPRIIAIASLVLLYALARVPEPGDAERRAVAARFRFEAATLPVVTPSARRTRTVRPSLERIDAWISSVGAAVALNDLDGDGLSNDVCYVDVRSDEVVVAPVPGTGSRFAAFDLLAANGCSRSATAAPMGALPIDADEDGRLDVIVYFWGRSPLLYLRGDGPPAAAAFSCREVLAPSEDWYTNAATMADIDGDGHPDLVAGNYFPDGARVLDPASTSPRMEMQASMSRAANGGRNRILLWQPDPRMPYRDAGDPFPPGTATAWTLALGAQDLDGDLLPDLYFANDFGSDHLLANRSTPGAPRFRLVQGRRRLLDPRSKVLGRDSFKGMGIDFADLNADGIPDLFVSNITDEFALEESNLLFVSRGHPFDYGDEGERRGLSRGGWAWDARFADFDNDGVVEAMQATGFIQGTTDRWPELHELAMGNDDLLHRERNWPLFRDGTDLSGDNHNPFFVRASDGRYHDFAPLLGLGTPMVSRGIAIADVDADGRLDFAVANQWGTSRFFRNRAPHAGSSLVLYVRMPAEPASTTRVVPGTPRGRSAAAIGAAVTVRSGGRTLIGQVDGGNGHSGKRGYELHFGLGDADQAEVTVAWRDRRGAIRRQSMHLREGVHTLLLANGLGRS